MADLSATDWKKALTSIVEELTASNCEKMLEFLEKIPRGPKTNVSKEQIPQIILEHYGEEESITAIKRVMDQIPRRDSPVQNLLQPFVDNLEEKKKGKKRKCETDPKSTEEKQESAAGFKKNKIVSDSESSDEEQEAEAEAEVGKKRTCEADSKLADKKQKSAGGFKKNKIVSDSESSEEEQEAEADDLKSHRSDQEKKIPPWRNTIHHVKISCDTKKKPIAGKVVQKSGLRTYQTKTKEKKFFFYLGIADETDTIKVMVYGKDRFQYFLEGSFYIFKNAIIEENIMKVTKRTTTAKTFKIEVPKDLELEAQMLVYNQRPVCTIAEAETSPEKTLLSVEGILKEIGSIEHVKVKTERRKKKKLDFKLEDDSGCIWISLWGENTKQLDRKSTGDFVRVINVKTSHYFDTVSLNSTDLTQIVKMQHAPVQNVLIEIIGIIQAGKIKTKMEVLINDQVHTNEVASSVLAKEMGLRLEGNFEDKLLEKLPFSAKAEIQGTKIKKLTAANEM